MEQPDLTKTINELEQQRDAIDRAVCALREVQGMSHPLKSASIYHQRADHEDNLFVNRTYILVTLNGFLAAAVGLESVKEVRLEFIGLALLIDIAWGLWAPRSKKFIRALRTAGGQREDQKLWLGLFGQRSRFTSWFQVLNITSIFMPWVWMLGWMLVMWSVWSITKTPSASVAAPTVERSYLQPSPVVQQPPKPALQPAKK